MCEGFEIPVELAAVIRDLITLDPPHLVNAVATLDGEQVGVRDAVDHRPDRRALQHRDACPPRAAAGSGTPSRPR